MNRVDPGYLGRLLRAQLPAEEYALLYEVRDGTGFHASRSADALAISLWPSRGLEVHGFEFKISRADWVKELRNPDKAEKIAAYCDRWWLVVSDEKIVKPGELPPAWGLKAVRGDKLSTITLAGKQENPTPLDRLFVAAIARAAQKHSPGARAIEKAVDAARQAWEKDRAKSDERVAGRRRDEVTELRERIQAFELASGVKITAYPPAKQIGEAVAIVLRGNLRIADHIDSAADQLEREVKTLRELAKLPALRDPVVIEAPAMSAP